MRVSETVGKGRLTLLCERLELPSFVFNALVRHVPASFHTAPQLAPLFLSTLFSALYLFALTLESYSFIPPIVCLPGAISLRNSWVCQVSRVDREWLQDRGQAPVLQRYVRA